MTKSILLLCLFCGITSVVLSGQSVQIKAEPAITQMESRFVASNRNTTATTGWRVQILATTDRQQLDAVRQDFQYRYPNIAVDWVHSKPYYKLRAGAFATRLEAMRLKYILQRDFDGLYLVRDDNIPRGDLLNSF